jgi:hypothetical protein
MPYPLQLLIADPRLHSQEDGSTCSVFAFDIAVNKSRLPLAKNAVRKLRTLRHPGVIKVLETVEVGSLYNATQTNVLARVKEADGGIDRYQYLHRYRESGTAIMACQTSEPEPGGR